MIQKKVDLLILSIKIKIFPVNIKDFDSEININFKVLKRDIFLLCFGMNFLIKFFDRIQCV